MKVVTIGRGISSAPFGGELYSGVSYVMPDITLETLREYERQSGFEIIAEERPYESTRAWNTGCGGSGTLLVWNTGAIGDQLWTTALVREIAQRYPALTIDVVATNYTDFLWSSHRRRNIRGVRLQPVPLETFQFYDHTLIFDELTMRETGNCYDKLFEATGIPVPPNAAPVIYPTQDHETSAYHLMLSPDAEGLVHTTRGHFIVGLHSSSEARNLPAQTIVTFIHTLAREAPNATIYGLSDDAFGGQIQEHLYMLPNYVRCHNKLNLLQIAALVRYATCVISPDSMLVHLAASQATPCVAIMTTVPPQDRVSTYPMCVPVYKHRACRFERCDYKRPRFEFQLGNIATTSKCYTPERTVCDIAKDVTVKEIFDAMNSAVAAKMRRGGFDDSSLPAE